MHINRYLNATKVFGFGTAAGLIASVILYVIILATSAVFGCQYPQSGSPNENQGAFGIDEIRVEGQCDAKINLTVRTPITTIPIKASVKSTQVQKRTVGGVIVTLMGGVSENVCEVDTQTIPAWKCRASVLGRDVATTPTAEPSTGIHPAAPPASAPYYDPTDPL